VEALVGGEASLKIETITMKTPFPVGDVNAYLVLHDPPTLIDAGLKFADNLAIMEKRLRDSGLGAKDLKRILLTHGHLDHYGNARALADASGAQPWIHEEDLKSVRPGPEPEEKGRSRYAAVLRKAGISDESLRVLGKWSESSRSLADSIERAETFCGESTVPFRDFSLSVMPSPGHTRGSIVFYEPRERILFSGDSLLEHITPNAFNILPEESGGLRNYMETLKRIGSLEIDTVYPGHGKPFHDCRAIIDRYFEFYEKRKSALLSVLSRDRGMKITDIIERLFGKLSVVEQFLAVSEVLGYVEIVRDEGLADVREDGGLWAVRALG
jgi:glyoxylase-like metal-dependent hydrolase (beta-lactamase superfamily II)